LALLISTQSLFRQYFTVGAQWFIYPWWTVISSLIDFLRVNYISLRLLWAICTDIFHFYLNQLIMFVHKDWNADLIFLKYILWSYSCRLGFTRQTVWVDGNAVYLLWRTAETSICN
jgi:hypothetical protein